MADAREFLQLLNQRFPVENPVRHFLTVCPETGRLEVCVALSANSRKNFSFEAADLKKSPQELVTELDVLVNKKT